MLPVRSTMGIAILVFPLVLGVSACRDEQSWSRSVRGDDGAGLSQIRPASRTVSDRQRERRTRRDRPRRRFGRDNAELLPHFGDYAVHETGFSTSRFKRAHGTLTVELVDDCGDWTLQEKWDLELVDQTDGVHASNLLYRGSEMRSAGEFVFAYSRDHFGDRADFIGDAFGIDGGYMARFRAPESTPDLFLPPDVVFPVTHLRQILSEARRERTEFETIVFDGGNDIAYRAVTAISQPLRADNPNPRVVAARTELDEKTSDRLPDGRHWPVRTDYFPLDDAFAPPIFTREFLLHESGVVLSFHIDYDDIQMDARLKTLDIRESLPCPR